MTINLENLTADLARIAIEAGDVIMTIYAREFSVTQKEDRSPVTEADQAAEDVILAGLARLTPDIPAVAEEAASAVNIPQIGDLFYLVDPLDGTKEFINKNGEFTVNIALIEKGKPIAGVVNASPYLAKNRRLRRLHVSHPHLPTTPSGSGGPARWRL